MITIKNALISCWDKTGLDKLAAALTRRDVRLISSGGTAAYLKKAGIPVTPVEQLTGFPEVLGGRVKTLHPAIHAALLSTDDPAHLAELEKHGIEPIQLVVVNLYPFVEEAVQKKLPPEEAIEFIDVGGPTMLRAAAKNYRHVLALHHPNQYRAFLELLEKEDGISESYSAECARKVFFYTSWYDARIQEYLEASSRDAETFADSQTVHLQKLVDLRYGENPHQRAAVFYPFGAPKQGMADLTQHWGKPLSYNNYVDVDAAYALVREFKETAAVVVKHTNPCGAAVSTQSVAEAFRKALRGDPLSAFGGIVAFNREVDAECAGEMAKIFFECIIAPSFSEGALEILHQKKNLRLLSSDPNRYPRKLPLIRSLSGAFLVQEADSNTSPSEAWKVVTKAQPDSALWDQLRFAWTLVKHVKSNAIVICKDGELYGTGAGQMSRVDSVKIAVMKAQAANRELNGTVLASDAFFPFRDGIDQAAQAGVMAIIQPGGSIRDEEVINAANEHEITMVFTGMRHFKH